MLALLFFLSIARADGPKYAPWVDRLSRSHEYLQTHDAPDFWKLIPYYQGGPCGPASMTMVMNAMRADRDLRASDRLITQDDLGSKIKIFIEGSDPGIK